MHILTYNHIYIHIYIYKLDANTSGNKNSKNKYTFLIAEDPLGPVPVIAGFGRGEGTFLSVKLLVAVNCGFLLVDFILTPILKIMMMMFNTY
jgi:hypothetical protein